MDLYSYEVVQLNGKFVQTETRFSAPNAALSSAEGKRAGSAAAPHLSHTNLEQLTDLVSRRSVEKANSSIAVFYYSAEIASPPKEQTDITSN